MKAFVAVLAVLLVVFGASIIYFRGDFNVGKKSDQLPVASNRNGGSQSDQLSQVVETKYANLEIRQNQIGALKVSESRTLTAIAKDEAGAEVSVNATWTVSPSSVATLVAVSGTETRLIGKKAGLATVTAIFKELKATLEIQVGTGAVAGIATPTVTTGTTSGAVGSGNVGVGNTLPPAVPFEIKLYDPTGARFSVGESRVFTSQVQYTDNSLKTPNLNWSVDPGGLGSLNKTSGASVTFTANGCGGGLLKAVLGNLSSSLYLQVCN